MHKDSMDPSKNESQNPYAVTVSDATGRLGMDASLPPVVVPFQGTIDEASLRKIFRDPVRMGCIITVMIGCAIVWAWVFGVVISGWAALLFGLVAVFVIYSFTITSLVSTKLKRCLAKRPWLLGATHGTVSGSRWTVWHNDVCIQTNDQIYFDEAYKGVILYPLSSTPIALVPSTCFYEHQWFELLQDYRRNRFMPLVIEAPPPDAFECALAPTRVLYLSDRYAAWRWRLSQSSFWIATVIGLFVHLWSRPYAIFGNGMVVVVPIAIWGVLEIGRFIWSRWSVNRQFHSEAGIGYRRADFAGNMERVGNQGESIALTQWFNQGTILSCDLHFWMKLPTRLIESVRIDAAAIEFRVAGMKLIFHREGFANEETWQSACRMAKELDPTRR
jgi:hypothetical protein